jgi:hypothetical protein
LLSKTVPVILGHQPKGGEKEMNETNTIKLERKADGTVVRANTSKRRGRPAGSGNPSLKLVCAVTGTIRATNQNYLNAKAARLGVSIDEIINNYVSKTGLKQLTNDSTIDATRKERLLKLNGGTRQRAARVELAVAAK